MSKIGACIFDIEGTLYKGGKLRQGVKELFSAIGEAETPVMFVTGMNEAETERVINMIGKETGRDMTGTMYACNGGSVMKYLGSEEYEWQNYLSSEDLAKIEKVVDEFSDSAIIVRRGKEYNFRQPLFETEGFIPKAKKLATQVIVKILEILKIVELDTKVATKEMIDEMDDIGSLEIVALPHVVKRLYKKISEAVPHLTINAGASLQVSAKGKIDVLNMMCEGDHEVLEDVVYFGDGVNDIECLKACGWAVASNCKKEAVIDVISEKRKDRANRYNTFATSNLGHEVLLKLVSGEELDSVDKVMMSDETEAEIARVKGPKKQTKNAEREAER